MEHDDAENFFSELEKMYDDVVKFRSFAFFHIVKDGKRIQLGGLLYIIKGMMVFEDFEKQQTLFGFIGGNKKKSYEKFKVTESLDDLEKYTITSAKTAEQFLTGKISRKQVLPSTLLDTWFGKRIIHIAFSNGDDWFMELMDHKEFTKVLSEYLEDVS